MRCDQCKFYIQSEESDLEGYCKRFPPIPIRRRTIDLLPDVCETEANDPVTCFVFPVVDDDGWCGEFQPKESLHGERKQRDLSLPVHKFPFSIIARNTLKKCGVITLADMRNVTLSKVMSFKSLNESTLIEIRDFCRMFGIRFR